VIEEESKEDFNSYDNRDHHNLLSDEEPNLRKTINDPNNNFINEVYDN
jgi:hypothetical protein